MPNMARAMSRLSSASAIAALAMKPTTSVNAMTSEAICAVIWLPWRTQKRNSANTQSAEKMIDGRRKPISLTPSMATEAACAQ